MTRRCLCSCHCAPDERPRAGGVDLRDLVEAAVACDVCRSAHSGVFTDKPTEYFPTESGEFLPPTRWTDEDGG